MRAWMIATATPTPTSSASETGRVAFDWQPVLEGLAAFVSAIWELAQTIGGAIVIVAGVATTVAALSGGWTRVRSLWEWTPIGRRATLKRGLLKLACGMHVDYFKERLGTPAFVTDGNRSSFTLTRTSWRTSMRTPTSPRTHARSMKFRPRVDKAMPALPGTPKKLKLARAPSTTSGTASRWVRWRGAALGRPSTSRRTTAGTPACTRPTSSGSASRRGAGTTLSSPSCADTLESPCSKRESSRPAGNHRVKTSFSSGISRTRDAGRIRTQMRWLDR